MRWKRRIKVSVSTKEDYNICRKACLEIWQPEENRN
jgi:hypothetical protein